VKSVEKVQKKLPELLRQVPEMYAILFNACQKCRIERKNTGQPL
jgi:hypothetical protein